MRYLCQGTLEIDVDGMFFPGAHLVISKNLQISDLGDDAWNLTILGQEQRMKRLGDELSAPWISIDGILFGEASQLDGEGVGLKWDRDLKMVNRTYVTLFGEGFGLWTCRLFLRRSGRILHLSLDGLTDFPISQDRELFPIRIHGYGEAPER